MTHDGSTHFKHRLHMNENPFGAAPSVHRVIQQFTPPHLYPDPHASALRHKISDVFHVPFSTILCSCGSEDLIHTVIRTFALAGTEVIIPEHGFCVYESATRSCGATPIKIPSEADKRLSVEKIRQAITEKTTLICLDHPGNPIGTYMPREALMTLIRGLPPHVILLLDTAYAEYMTPYPDYDDGLQAALMTQQVVVTRSFSKAYGLAGLRLGWLVASAPLIAALTAFRIPFKASAIAQQAGLEALNAMPFVDESVRYVHQQRQKLEDVLEKHGILAFRTTVNFALASFSSAEQAQDFVAYLKNNNVYVLHLIHYSLDQFVRISIGSNESMAFLIEKMDEYF